MNGFKALIFDVDGTLLDSFESNLEFIRELMKAKGYRPPTREEFLPLFHTSLWDVIKKLTGLTDETEIKNIWDFARANTATLKAKPAVMPGGAEETIKLLSERYALGIATGRVRVTVYEPPLDTLRPYFKIAVAYEDTMNHKPNPEPLLLAAEKLGVSPDECIYIGDAETDMQASVAAGMHFVHFGSVPMAGAKYSIRTFKELPAIIKILSERNIAEGLSNPPEEPTA